MTISQFVCYSEIVDGTICGAYDHYSVDSHGWCNSYQECIRKSAQVHTVVASSLGPITLKKNIEKLG